MGGEGEHRFRRLFLQQGDTMVFKVQMKDPDALIEAIEDAVKELTFPDLDEDEIKQVREKRKAKALESCRRWFRSGEYLTVQIDTDFNTCVVIENV